LAKHSVIEELLASLPADQRRDVLIAAGRERAGRDIFGPEGPAELKALVPLLLRRIHIPSELFKEVLREANISLRVPVQDLRIEVPFIRSSASHRAIPITELAAASLVM